MLVLAKLLANYLFEQIFAGLWRICQIFLSSYLTIYFQVPTQTKSSFSICLQKLILDFSYH